jgi:hypothetical protein
MRRGTTHTPKLAPLAANSRSIRRRRLCINKAILLAHGLPIAYERRNSVYPACTSVGRIRCFWRFFSFHRINNLSVFSVALSSIPTAPTNQLF